MKYYLIPLVDTDIYYHCQSLRDILREKFPLLARREEQRIDILYSTRFYEPIPKQELNAHNHETMLIYQKETIPMYLIAYGTDELSAHEIFSGEVLLAKYPAALGIREVTKDSAEKYFKENDYFNKISNFFKHVYVEDLSKPIFDQEPFSEVSEVKAYLNGQLDGKPFNGEFTGTLKLTKKNHKIKN